MSFILYICPFEGIFPLLASIKASFGFIPVWCIKSSAFSVFLVSWPCNLLQLSGRVCFFFIFVGCSRRRSSFILAFGFGWVICKSLGKGFTSVGMRAYGIGFVKGFNLFWGGIVD